MDVVIYGVVSFAVDLIVLWVGKTMRDTSLKTLASASDAFIGWKYARRGSVFFKTVFGARPSRMGLSVFFNFTALNVFAGYCKLYLACIRC